MNQTTEKKDDLATKSFKFGFALIFLLPLSIVLFFIAWFCFGVVFSK